MNPLTVPDRPPKLPADFDMTATYEKLTAAEKLHLAEFIDFLFSSRSHSTAKKFHLRDHNNRTDTTTIAIPEQTPPRWDELSIKEKALVKWFIDELKR